MWKQPRIFLSTFPFVGLGQLNHCMSFFASSGVGLHAPFITIMQDNENRPKKGKKKKRRKGLQFTLKVFLLVSTSVHPMGLAMYFVCRCAIAAKNAFEYIGLNTRLSGYFYLGQLTSRNVFY